MKKILELLEKIEEKYDSNFVVITLFSDFSGNVSFANGGKEIFSFDSKKELIKRLEKYAK